MPPDFYFALTLIVKMAVTAGFVLAATVTAERAGPLVSALVATLPISAGPVYVFLALDHDAHFIARSAVASLAVNALNVVFATVYTRLAQTRPLAVSLGGAYAVWIAMALIVNSYQWSMVPALALNVVAVSLGLWIARPFRHTAMPRLNSRWPDFVLRALLVAVLVGVVVTFSFRIGAYGSGLLAVFPIVLTSIILILHHRAGGKPTAAVIANAPLGLAGFALCCVTLHFAAVPLGVAGGFALALAVSIGCNLAVLTARRHGIAV